MKSFLENRSHYLVAVIVGLLVLSAIIFAAYQKGRSDEATYNLETARKSEKRDVPTVDSQSAETECRSLYGKTCGWQVNNHEYKPIKGRPMKVERYSYDTPLRSVSYTFYDGEFSNISVQISGHGVYTSDVYENQNKADQLVTTEYSKITTFDPDHLDALEGRFTYFTKDSEAYKQLLKAAQQAKQLALAADNNATTPKS